MSRWENTDRYAAPSPWVKPVIITATALLVILAAIWAIWSVFLAQGPHIEARDLGHTLLPESNQVRVSWELSVDPGTETACAIQALNEQFQTVGWKVFEIPASDEYTRRFEETIRAAMVANTGFVYRCWVP